MEEKEVSKGVHIRAFEGLRTIAVVAIVLYHMQPTIFKGGYMGVPILFVLAGYLLANSLRKEYQKAKSISLGSYYKKRIKRLFPALLAMFLLSITYMLFFQRDLLLNIRPVVLSSFSGTNNLWQIFNGQSYFEQYLTPSPFTHLWALGIEIQFFLLFPILFVILQKLTKKRSVPIIILLLLSCASAAWMAYLFVPGADPSRVYYGTDTRMFSLLIGAMFAYIVPMGDKKEISKTAKQLITGIGAVALVMIFIGIFYMDAQSTWNYTGGIFLYSLCSGLLIAMLSFPKTVLARVLTNPIFDWIGKRSYGIYLYQLPVMLFYESKVPNINDHMLAHSIVEIVILLVVVELSYRLLEKPIMKMDLKSLKKSLQDIRKSPSFSMHSFQIVLLVVLVALSSIGLVIKPPVSKAQQLQDQLEADAKEAERVMREEEERKQAIIDALPDPTPEYQQTLTEMEMDFDENQTRLAYNMRVSVIGDSLMVGTQLSLLKIFPFAYVDAMQNRSLQAGEEILNTMIADGTLEDKVVINLGANRYFTAEDVDYVMQLVGDREVYWVNLHVPTKRYEGEVNDMLDNQSKVYDNLTIIDWKSLSKDQPDWFWADSVHPNIEGQKNYAKLIARTIIENTKL